MRESIYQIQEYIKKICKDNNVTYNGIFNVNVNGSVAKVDFSFHFETSKNFYLIKVYRIYGERYELNNESF